jgi:hypothetical protein
VLKVLIESVERMSALEQVFAPKAKGCDVEAAKIVAEGRRQRARTGEPILRAPTSRPV